jgi:hypothetical protein
MQEYWEVNGNIVMNKIKVFEAAPPNTGLLYIPFVGNELLQVGQTIDPTDYNGE